MCTRYPDRRGQTLHQKEQQEKEQEIFLEISYTFLFWLFLAPDKNSTLLITFFSDAETWRT
jgi:hypothetical protein